MTYQPKTTLNAAWVAKEEEWRHTAERMKSLRDQAERGSILSPAPVKQANPF